MQHVKNIYILGAFIQDVEMKRRPRYIYIDSSLLLFCPAPQEAQWSSNRAMAETGERPLMLSPCTTEPKTMT